MPAAGSLYPLNARRSPVRNARPARLRNCFTLPLSAAFHKQTLPSPFSALYPHLRPCPLAPSREHLASCPFTPQLHFPPSHHVFCAALALGGRRSAPLLSCTIARPLLPRCSRLDCPTPRLIFAAGPCPSFLRSVQPTS